MKRRLVAAVCLLALVFLGCGSQSGQSSETVEIYRVVKSEYQMGGELLRAETLPKASGVTALDFVLNQLQTVSDSIELGRSMPEGVKIISRSLVGSEMMLELSEEYLELDGIEKTLTDYCIVLSLSSLSEIQTVSIYVGSELVTPGLSSGDVLLYDGEESPYEKQVRLYFAERNARYLSVEYHTLSVSDDSMLEKYIVDELLRGPNDDLLVSAIPEGTSLVSITTADGLCTVRLSNEFWTNRPESFAGERLAVYSIVNSLTSLSEVSEVMIEVEGMPSDRYVYMDLSSRLVRCDSVIGPVNSAKGEMDVDIYMALPGLDRLTPIPYIVERDEYLSIETCIILEMTQAESEGGVISLLSQCGRPNLVSTRNGVCNIDVPEGFFDSCGDNKTLAVEALIATVCAIDGINGVSITVDGASLELNGTHYTAARTTNEEIILH